MSRQTRQPAGQIGDPVGRGENSATVALDEPTLQAVVAAVRDALAVAPGPALVDAKAAGELLGVPDTWVAAQARAGRIPHVKLGHYTRFDPVALRSWAASRMRGPQR